MICRRAVVVTLITGVAILCPSGGQADDESAGIFALRNQNPFLQVFGLPAFQTANLVPPSHPAWNLGLDIANHADSGATATENFAVDGETYFLTVSMRRRVADWLELGFDVPFVSHADGFMDDMIEGWHDLFGMSNTKRRGPSNQLGFLYQRDGEALYRLASPAAGIGDIQVLAAIPLRRDRDGWPRITIRSSLKLPTGDPDRLLGSGGTDLSVGIYTASVTSMLGRPLALNGFAGGLTLGSGEILSTLQRDFVVFGGASATWQATGRFAVAMQFYAQGPYYDSDVEELGGNSLQLSAGLILRLGTDSTLRLAVVEDVAANATTDFAVHVSARIRGAAR
jgi:hypothetical protein